jgi:hypothetical protein
MKKFGFISTAFLFLLMGITASISAQDDREKPQAQPAAHDEKANPPEEKRAPEAKPAQDEEKRTQQDEKQDDKKAQNDEKREQKNDKQENAKQENEKQVQDQQKQQQKDEKRAQQDDKNHPQVRPTQDAHRAGNNGGGRIPDDKFRSSFGHDHHFRMNRPTVVSGQPRFQYGGYWFVIGDAWPVGWDYSDDCYIDYVDGEYLLFDLAHPGASIVISVVL